MRTKSTLRITTVGALCLCLTIMSTPFTSGATIYPRLLVDNNETPEQGASQFDEGVNEVKTILNLDLSTEKGIKEAAEILKRAEKKLLKFDKKAMQAALRVEAFKKGLKDEAAKRKGGEAELANELETKPGSVGNIPGAEEAAEAIRRSTQPAADLLQRVSDTLQKAGDAAKKKAGQHGHHASKRSVPSINISSPVQPPNPALFCGTYQAICDVLTRLGLHILRRTVETIEAYGTKAVCLKNAYVAYGGCVITHYWDTAYCAARLASMMNICVRYV